jgi:hypothetical protein
MHAGTTGGGNYGGGMTGGGTFFAAHLRTGAATEVFAKAKRDKNRFCFVLFCFVLFGHFP